MSELMIYKTKDGSISIDVNLTDDTVWLSVNQMASLFKRERSVILKHLRNMFKNKELEKTEPRQNLPRFKKREREM